MKKSLTLLSPNEKSPNGSKTVDPHTALVNEVIAKIGALPTCRVWKNPTGAGISFAGNAITFGLPGSPDVIGLTSDGRLLCIECKTGSARLSKKQEAFMHMVSRFGGRYILCREIKETINYLNLLNLPLPPPNI